MCKIDLLTTTFCRMVVVFAMCFLGGCFYHKSVKSVSCLGEKGTIFFLERKDLIGLSAEGKTDKISQLSYLDAQTGQRGELLLEGEMESQGWSIEGDFLACCIDGEWSVRSLSSGNVLCTIPGQFLTSSICPSLDKVALLASEGVMWSPHEYDEKKLYMLGERCRLYLYSLPSGKLITECEQLVLNFGICWTGPDWSNIVITSMKNITDFEYEKKICFEGKSYSYPANPKIYPLSLYCLNVNNEEYSYLCEGHAPKRSADGRSISFEKNNSFFFLRTTNVMVNANQIMPAKETDRHLSPSGKYALLAKPPLFEWNINGKLFVVQKGRKKIESTVSKNLVSGPFFWSSIKIDKTSIRSRADRPTLHN